jgi:SAM-dependent methyltransferase
MEQSNTNTLWKTKSDWFVDWFDSDAYPVLYGHRDQEEAEQGVEALCRSGLLPAPPARVLDLGCGSGRHARGLAARGFETLGVDLSAASLARAAAQPRSGLTFLRGDMRQLPALLAGSPPFDAVIQWFTSFGFFEHPADQSAVLEGVRAALRPQGLYVLDYLNLPQVLNTLQPKEDIERVDAQGNTWHFAIHRRVEAGWVEKDIRYNGPDGANGQHVERVRAHTPQVLLELCKRHRLEPFDQRGNYSFEPWSESSPRCIIFARSI